MRFNGNGTYQGATDNDSCDTTIAPSYNSQTITSGAEIGLWVWQQYLMTDDPAFLRRNYPIIRGAAKFLLSYATVGPDGLLHTTANAHETQWHVTDPVTDVLAMRALFPSAVKAAKALGVDAGLVKQLNAAIPEIPPLPRTDTATRTQNLTAADDAAGTDMIGWSTQPTAPFNNSENLGLEAVFPYAVIGDDSPLTTLARRTFTSRPFVNSADWAYDPLDAARLGLAADVKSTLVDNLTKYQVYPSGLANFSSAPGNEPYIEQSGVLAATVSEAFVQDYDGLLRIAPAWPADWTGEGTVAIQHNSRVSVQVSGGTVGTVAIAAGAIGNITMRSPWPGQKVTVADGRGAIVVRPQSKATFTIPVRAGQSYRVQPAATPAQAFAPVTGSPATAFRSLRSVSIGLGTATPISLRAHANNLFVNADHDGADSLIANGTEAGPSETFDLIDLGNGDVALQSHANHEIVTNENGGASPLIANRTAIGDWEKFLLIDDPDGSVSLKALVNNDYVTADNGGAAPLIANRTTIGPGEEFDLLTGVGAAARTGPRR
jgi:hypothetical protein